MDDSKLNDILNRAKSSKLLKREVLDIIVIFKNQVKSHSIPITTRLGSARKVLSKIIFVLYRVLPCLLFLLYVFQRLKALWSEDPCLVPRVLLNGEVTLPVADCGVCSNLTKVPVVENTTVASFLEQYAYSSRPVLMKGAAKGWPAAQLFSYEYFRQLYSQRPEAILRDGDEGQFFAYSSDVRRLDEFMNMTGDQAAMRTGKWYIGW